MTSASAKHTMLRLINESGKRLGKLSSYDFYTAWSKYDQDGNGYIEERELEDFLREYLTTVCGMQSTQCLTTKGLQELTAAFLAEHDRDKDGRISIHELSAILPTDQTFLLIFRQKVRLDSSEDFMQIWRKYDADNSGYIEMGELKVFLNDVLRGQKVDSSKINDYAGQLMEIFDTNKDGKLSLEEAAQLLPVKENFLRTAVTKADLGNLDTKKVGEIFNKYDRDNNGFIDAGEIDDLCTDILAMSGKPSNPREIATLKEVVIRGCDLDGDGKINKKELAMIFRAISKDKIEVSKSLSNR